MKLQFICYSLFLNRFLDNPILQDLISQTREKQAATMSELKWRGRTVQVKNEQVRLFLLNVQENENEVSEVSDIDNKISLLESLLKECIDAQQVLRDELKNDPVSRHT